MRRRRRARGTWLPILGTNPSVGDSHGFRLVSLAFTAQEVIDGLGINAVVPLTFDTPAEGEQLTNNDRMSEIIGSEYFLQRIVGKAFVTRYDFLDIEPIIGYADSSFVGQFICTCGFFVARAEDFNGSGGPDVPIGYNQGNSYWDSYSPQALNAIREPWIWRRSWILGNAVAKAVQTGNLENLRVANAQYLHSFPSNNVECGSVLDGPHIDAKTRRRIGQDDRLYFAASAIAMRHTDYVSPEKGTEIQIDLDYRLFGQLRKSKQRGAF